jgi:hypothetical protein
MDWKTGGALAFGAVIGWYLYFINRYRKADVAVGDITTVIGAIGGAGVLALFSKDTDLFGAYGVGLAIGFFGYFLSLIILIGWSKDFNADWFLDGRRPNPPDGWGFGTDIRQTVHPMALNPTGTALPASAFYGTNPGATQNFYFNTGTGASAQQPLAIPLPPMLVLNHAAQTIVDTCKDVWPAAHEGGGTFHENCNWFAIEVASRLGVTLTGSADDIVNQIGEADWTKVSNGPAARDAVTQGKFVVCGIKSTDFTHPRDHGHVAVVVPGALNPAGWAPAGYWGSDSPDVASDGGAGKPISLCFRAEDKDKIYYASRDV